MYCRFRLPVSTNKRSGCAEAGRVAYIIRSCSSPWVTMSHVMVTQQGSVFGDAAGTRRHGQALNALAVTQSQWRPKGPFLRRSCQDIHFKEGPGFFRRLFPLVTCLPSQGCVAQLAFQAGVRSCPFPVTALPNRGKLFQAWATGLRCGEQVALVCWTKRRLLGDGRNSWGTSWHRARGTRGVTQAGAWGGGWVRDFSSHSGDRSKLGSRDLQIRDRDSKNCRGSRDPSRFIQLPICQMGKLRPREKKGSWPRQHSRFFLASSHGWEHRYYMGPGPPPWPAGKLGSGGGRLSLGTWVTLQRRLERTPGGRRPQKRGSLGCEHGAT